MVTCADCVHVMNITEEIRLRLGQENKEIVNTLERQGLRLDEFCYCEKLGYIESVESRILVAGYLSQALGGFLSTFSFIWAECYG